MKKVRIYALVMALIVFMISYLSIEEANQEAAKMNQVRSVEIVAVGAVNHIMPNTEITEDMVTLYRYVVPEGETDYFAQVSDVVGRIARSDIYANERLTSLRTVSKTSSYAGLASYVKEGMRAITVPVSAENAIGYNLKVGDRVDVLYSSTIDSELDETIKAKLFFDATKGEDEFANSVFMDEIQEDTYVSTALQDVEVIALDQVFNRTDNNLQGFATITLQVQPKEALKLEYLKSNGNPIFLTLRSFADHKFENNAPEYIIITRDEMGDVEKSRKDSEKVLSPQEESHDKDPDDELREKYQALMRE